MVRLHQRWQQIDALVDSGAEENLIGRALGDEVALRTSEGPLLESFSGEVTGTYGQAFPLVKITDSWDVTETQRHSFVVTTLKGPQLVLGMPWLGRVDPMISWSTQEWRYPIYAHNLSVVTQSKDLV